MNKADSSTATTRPFDVTTPARSKAQMQSQPQAVAPPPPRRVQPARATALPTRPLPPSPPPAYRTIDESELIHGSR